MTPTLNSHMIGQEWNWCLYYPFSFSNSQTTSCTECTEPYYTQHNHCKGRKGTNPTCPWTVRMTDKTSGAPKRSIAARNPLASPATNHTKWPPLPAHHQWSILPSVSTRNHKLPRGSPSIFASSKCLSHFQRYGGACHREEWSWT